MTARRAGPFLGCIADDLTGGTDLASALTLGGMCTEQLIGLPHGPITSDADALVISLKSRDIPAVDAVRLSLAALSALRDAGCARFMF